MSGKSNIEKESRKIHCNQCMVGELLTDPFFQREPARKTEIAARGRLTPELDKIFGPKIPTNIRIAMSSWYSLHPWLTCCEHLKKLFCWTCLLFREGQRGTGIWTVKGFSDIGKFLTVAKRHEISKSHMLSVIGREKFRRMRLGAESEHQQLPSTEEGSRCPDIDETDRILFKRLIDVNCVEILRLEKETKKRKRSTKIQNTYGRDNTILFHSEEVNGRIVNSLYGLLSDKIKKDIVDSPFFSISVNTISDILEKTYYVIIYRYMAPQGKILERVFKVTGYSKDKPDNLQTKLCDWMEEIDTRGELISLSFDGGVKVSQQKSILNRIKNKYEYVLLVNCYNHRLNLNLQQSVEHIPSCRSFFQTVAKLALFFSQTKRRKRAYFTVVGKFDSDPTSIFTAQFLLKIHENFESLLSLLETMFKYKDDWDGVTNVEARGFYETFKDFNFVFLLSIFSRILPVSENLHGVINKYVFIDPKNCSDCITRFISDMMEYVDGFETIWDDVNKLEEIIEEPDKKKNKTNQSKRDSYQQLYMKIVESISRQVIHRYMSFNRLQFLPLLDTRKFIPYSYNFPEKELVSLENEFPEFFDMDRLRKQLSEIYVSKVYRKLNLTQLHKFLIDSGKQKHFDQVMRLVTFSLVFPICKLEGSSALANVNSYLISSGRKMTKKSILRIEKDFLKQLWTEPSFYDSLISYSSRSNDETR